VGHQPVLLAEVLDFLGGAEEQIRVLVDATLGLGGHAEAFLDRFSKGEVVGLDRDAEILDEARSRLARYSDRVTFRHAAFADLGTALDDSGRPEVDAVLFDFGVSSPQLDRADRGFSFREDGPLDMRMDRSRGETAADLIARLRETELADLIYRLGDERASRGIATAIVRERKKHRIETTGQLAEIVRGAVRGGGRIDKATRTFQALRMAVNGELEQIEAGLDAAANRLRPGGRLLAISFHSGEDRLVKNFLRSDERLDVITKKVVRAGPEEVRSNPRARSSRLRVAGKRRVANRA
jgi:16S rRNA (cytosine1402-N4)-methyltransferase